MKNSIRLVVAFIGLLVSRSTTFAADATPWGPMTNNLQMSITLADNKTNIAAGKDFTLLIQYKNASSNETFMVYEVNGTIYDSTYSFEITSPSGRNVSLETPTLGVSGAMRLVRPNQVLAIRFPLGQLRKLNGTGKYRIIASKRDMWSPGKEQSFTVVSNPLFVTVVSER